jgi:cyclophilin family peptidyl-prolyl cis-trans isomerase
MANATARVRIGTTLGTIVIELYGTDAPVTVDNFLHYVRSGYYVGTIFHRVIPGFMVQGGGMEEGMWEKTTGQRPAIPNESGNGLMNDLGTVAMARTSEPDSATSQFFINVRNNGSLNRDHCRDGVGYAVFGRVVDGMDVVHKIERVRTRTQSGYGDVPIDAIAIVSTELFTD